MGKCQVVGVADAVRINEALYADAMARAEHKNTSVDDKLYWLRLAQEFKDARARFAVRLDACGNWMTSVRSV